MEPYLKEMKEEIMAKMGAEWVVRECGLDSFGIG
jgi:hypothetical protein